MALLPSDVPTGIINGEFWFVNEDSVDAGTDPDLMVVTGTVTFTASVPVIRMPSKLATIIPMKFDAEFNSSGLLVPKGQTTPGIKLPATDSTLLSPLNYTWKVEFNLKEASTGFSVVVPSFSFSVPAGSTQDLTTLFPVDTSPGTITIQGPAGANGPAGAPGGILPFKGSTFYPAGTMAINPSGYLVTAKADFTSTATYSASNWDLTSASQLLTQAMVRMGVLADGTNIDNLRVPGIYTVGSAASAGTMSNLPVNVPCEVWVSKNDTNTLTIQRTISVPASGNNFGLYTRTTRSASVWDTLWASDREFQGTLPDGTQLQTFRKQGTYLITNATSAATMGDMPVFTGLTLNTAILRVVAAPGIGGGAQYLTMYQADGSYAHLSRVTRVASSFPAWQWDNPPAAPAAATDLLPNAGTRHAYLQQAAYMRRGKLGVQGKAVVSIRFDHWLNDMRAKVIPLLDKYMLPGSLCLNADNMSLDQNLGTTWAQVTDMALHQGVEIWNHGADHVDHTTPESIVDAIVGGQARLQAAVGPKLIVDGWMSNGSSYYDNFNFGRGFAAWTDTLAAKAIMNSHAFADGKNSGYLQPMDGHIKLGASHYSAESSGSAVAISRIEEAKKRGAGITIYFHPGLIDQPGGFVLSDLEALFSYLATERDAGRIEVLTVSGMNVANGQHSIREDLLTNTQFANDFSGWTKSAGYTLRTENGKQLVSASATATNLYQNISLYTNFGWAMGGMCELVVPARATGGVEATLRLQVFDTTDNTRLNKEKLFVLPADGSVKWCRIFVTMPAEQDPATGNFLTTSIRATVARASGGSIDYMDEPHLRPV